MISKTRSRLVHRLRTRRRSREGLFLVEGVRGAGEAMEAGAEVAFAVVSPGLGRSGPGSRLEARLQEAGVDLLSVGDRELEELSDTESPQGVLLVCSEPCFALEDLGAGSGRGILILDGIQDPGNLGSLVRAARAFDLRGVVALEGTVDPWNPKAVRASAGATFHLPVLKADWDAVGAWLRSEELSLLVADPTGTDVADEEVGSSWALVVGNEGVGARREVMDAADRVVSIPMAGGGDSLNAGVAGAILLYALVGAGRG